MLVFLNVFLTHTTCFYKYSSDYCVERGMSGAELKQGDLLGTVAVVRVSDGWARDRHGDGKRWSDTAGS